jgi:hypothetical protein
MQKNGIIGIVVLLFICTFMSVIYFLGSGGHAFEKIAPITAARSHENSYSRQGSPVDKVPGDTPRGAPNPSLLHSEPEAAVVKPNPLPVVTSNGLPAPLASETPRAMSKP